MKLLLAQSNVSVDWVQSPSGTVTGSGNEGDRPPDPASMSETRADALIVDVSSIGSSERIAELTIQAVANRPVAPRVLCVAHDHDWTRGGLREVARLAVWHRSKASPLISAIERAGYAPVHTCFSPRPIAEARFLTVDTDLYTLPPHAHRLRHVADFVGLERLKYSSTVVFGIHDEEPCFPLLAEIPHWLQQGAGTAPIGQPALLGFQVRTRGTLLVYTEMEPTSERIVTKLSLQADVDEQLRNSFGLQNWLRGTVSDPLRSIIPEPLAYIERTRLSRSTVYLETMEQGVVAWKVNVGRKAERIERDAFDVLERLQDETHQPMKCDAGVLQELLGPTIQRAKSSPRVKNFLVEGIARLAQRIRADHAGKTIGFVAAHGDFGIGNVLVERKTGALTAVVDWADGRRREFPTVDPVNWQIQQRRDQKNQSFPEAVKALSTDLSRGSSSIDPSYLVPGRSRREQNIAALRTAVFRYVGRSLKYPDSLEAECGRQRVVADLLNELASSG